MVRKARSRFAAILIRRLAFVAVSPMLKAESSPLSRTRLLGQVRTGSYTRPLPKHLVAKVSAFRSVLYPDGGLNLLFHVSPDSPVLAALASQFEFP